MTGLILDLCECAQVNWNDAVFVLYLHLDYILFSLFLWTCFNKWKTLRGIRPWDCSLDKPDLPQTHLHTYCIDCQPWPLKTIRLNDSNLAIEIGCGQLNQMRVPWLYWQWAIEAVLMQLNKWASGEITNIQSKVDKDKNSNKCFHLVGMSEIRCAAGISHKDSRDLPIYEICSVLYNTESFVFIFASIMFALF